MTFQVPGFGFLIKPSQFLRGGKEILVEGSRLDEVLFRRRVIPPVQMHETQSIKKPAVSMARLGRLLDRFDEKILPDSPRRPLPNRIRQFFPIGAFPLTKGRIHPTGLDFHFQGMDGSPVPGRGIGL